DPTGRVMAFHDTTEGETVLVEVPSGAYLGVSKINHLGPEARLRIYENLHERGRVAPLLWFDNDINSSLIEPVTIGSFSPDGRHTVGTHANGTVTVCDLTEVQRRLAELRLGW